MAKFIVEKLGGNDIPRHRRKSREFPDSPLIGTPPEVLKWADSVVREWRAQGYRGGCQLKLMGGPFPDGSLCEVYGRDFK